MALYAIGDVQGCFGELERLLDLVHFDPGHDRLWFTGDLVNRGPQSLETLRLVHSLGDSAIAVLGNHDLHLLAVAAGVSHTKHRDTFADVLRAPDRDELLDWLRCRPLIHCEGELYLIHAGVPPQWSADDAVRYGAEVQAVLAGPDATEFFRHMYGDQPDHWSDSLSGWDRLRFITNCFTRMRYCDRHGRLDYREKGRPGSQAAGLLPWFAIPGRRTEAATVVFGHWSTLGFHAANGVFCLDTGCLWGGELTALRLDGEPRRHSISCGRGPYQKPG